MKGRRQQRDSAAHSLAEERPAPRFERMLRLLGVHRVFAEQVLGDLAESYEERAAQDGVAAARWWYAREMLRSAPHLLWSAVRDGSPLERARLAACLTGLALVATIAATAVAMRKGPPARLFAATGKATDGIVVNNLQPVQLPMRVVDAKGRVLDATGVRYEWKSGSPLAVSPGGVVACDGHGDAVVRATLGNLSRQVVVRCRPVDRLVASSWMTLFLGDAPRDLPFAATGIDGRPVTELRGKLRVLDSTIATLSGSTVRPIGPGETRVIVTVGDRHATIRVLVHEWVTAFTRLRPDQRLVAIPVRLAQGDTVRHALPVGTYWVKYLPGRSGDAPPTIIADVLCQPGDGIHANRLLRDEYAAYCPIHSNGGGITLAHGRMGAPVVTGTLAIERLPDL
jgi:hypothetical protein